MSKYLPVITSFMLTTRAKSVYAFVVDGQLGTGGCPLVALPSTHPEYVDECRRLLEYMKRSVALFEQDIERIVLERERANAPGGQG